MYKKRFGKKRTGGRLKKRWSTGFSVGGYGLKASAHFNSRRSLASAVNHIVRRDLETPQHYTVDDTTNQKFPCTHNTFYTFNLTSGIAQGTTDNGRIGDEIHIDALKYNCMLSSSGSQNNSISCRLLIVKSPKQYNVNVWGSGLGQSELAQYGQYATGSTYSANLLIDPKKVTVLMDKAFTLTPQIASQNVQHIERGIIKIDQKFVYNSDTVYGKMYNIYMVFVCSAVGATTGVTGLVNLCSNTDLIFKNSK